MDAAMDAKHDVKTEAAREAAREASADSQGPMDVDTGVRVEILGEPLADGCLNLGRATVSSWCKADS